MHVNYHFPLNRNKTVLVYDSGFNNIVHQYEIDINIYKFKLGN